MASERQLRQQICDCARTLYERGHNAPADGNVSARLSERYLLCTPTLSHKGALSAQDIVKVRAEDGSAVDRGQTASSEIRMHLAIYAHRPDIGAIVHAHSPNTVGLSVAGVSLQRPVVPEAILALGGVPTVPYASPTTQDVASAVLPFALRYDAFVLERHGPVSLGADLDQAFGRLEIVEHTARITIAALSAGGAKPLPEQEAARLRAMAVAAGVLRDPDGAPPSLGEEPRAETIDDALLDALAERVVRKLR